jgi:hypothetical protein
MAWVFVPHPGQVEGDLHGLAAGEGDRLAGDVHRQVADPLQVVVDLQGRHDEPQIGRHRLVEGQDLQTLLLDLHLALVDLQVPADGLVRQLVVAA